MKPSAPLKSVLCLAAAGLLSAGCDRLGFLPDPAVVAATAEAEGKAVGAACRNAGRGLEDCYQKNPKAVKSAVFAGWKDMNEYMSQNKMEVIAPPPPPPPPPPVKKEEEEEDGDHKGKSAGKHEKDADDEKPAGKDKKAAKHG